MWHLKLEQCFLHNVTLTYILYWRSKKCTNLQSLRISHNWIERTFQEHYVTKYMHNCVIVRCKYSTYNTACELTLLSRVILFLSSVISFMKYCPIIYSIKVVFNAPRNNYNVVLHNELIHSKENLLNKENVRDTFRVFPKFKEII